MRATKRQQVCSRSRRSIYTLWHGQTRGTGGHVAQADTWHGQTRGADRAYRGAEAVGHHSGGGLLCGGERGAISAFGPVRTPTQTTKPNPSNATHVRQCARSRLRTEMFRKQNVRSERKCSRNKTRGLNARSVSALVGALQASGADVLRRRDVCARTEQTSMSEHKRANTHARTQGGKRGGEGRGLVRRA